MARGVVAIVGAGPGLGQMIGNLSFEVAKKFGQQGFKIAFISLAASTLEQYVKDLKALGIADVETFRSDVFDLSSQEALYTDVQAKMGPITVLIWNHFAHVLEPALSQTPEQLESQFKGLAALVRSVQLVIPQQEAHLEDKPAILITGNGMGLVERESVQKAAAHAGAHILAAHSAAKHSLAATLHHSLQPKGIKVVEVVIQGVIHGTAHDRGEPGTLAPEEVAEVFWKQYNAEAGEPWYAFI